MSKTWQVNNDDDNNNTNATTTTTDNTNNNINNNNNPYSDIQTIMNKVFKTEFIRDVNYSMHCKESHWLN